MYLLLYLFYEVFMEAPLSYILFFIKVAVELMQLMVFVYVILSWLPQIKAPAIREFIWTILGPLFRFVKKYMPRFGMLDLSPIFVILLLNLALEIIERIARSFL